MFVGFPGDLEVKNLPCSTGDMGSIPSPGRSHMTGATKIQYHNYWSTSIYSPFKKSLCSEKPPQGS